MTNQNIQIASKREDPFSRVPKSMLNDSRLSWKAKGILAYLIGQPVDWKVQQKDLSKKSTDGSTAIKSALKELRTLGYAELKKVTDEKGKVIEWIWKISDFPIFSPEVDFPLVDNPLVGNRPLIKTEVTKNDLTKKSKETLPSESASFPATLKPSTKDKSSELDKIRTPDDYPTQDSFNEFVDSEGLVGIDSYRPDLYDELCRNKWHTWSRPSHKWVAIRDWRAFVSALNETIEFTNSRYGVKA